MHPRIAARKQEIIDRMISELQNIFEGQLLNILRLGLLLEEHDREIARMLFLAHASASCVVPMLDIRTASGQTDLMRITTNLGTMAAAILERYQNLPHELAEGAPTASCANFEGVSQSSEAHEAVSGGIDVSFDVVWG